VPEECFLGGIMPLERLTVSETEDRNETKPMKIHYISSALRKVESKAEFHVKMHSQISYVRRVFIENMNGQIE
jgi:hypothetical protein